MCGLSRVCLSSLVLSSSCNLCVLACSVLAHDAHESGKVVFVWVISYKLRVYNHHYCLSSSDCQRVTHFFTVSCLSSTNRSCASEPQHLSAFLLPLRIPTTNIMRSINISRAESDNDNNVFVHSAIIGWCYNPVTCLYSTFCPPCAIATAKSTFDGSDWCFNCVCFGLNPCIVRNYVRYLYASHPPSLSLALRRIHLPRNLPFSSHPPTPPLHSASHTPLTPLSITIPGWATRSTDDPATATASVRSCAAPAPSHSS